MLPAWPKVDSLKYGLSGDITICSTSLVMSSSLKASFKHSDCNTKSSILVYNSRTLSSIDISLFSSLLFSSLLFSSLLFSSLLFSSLLFSSLLFSSLLFSSLLFTSLLMMVKYIEPWNNEVLCQVNLATC